MPYPGFMEATRGMSIATKVQAPPQVEKPRDDEARVVDPLWWVEFGEPQAPFVIVPSRHSGKASVRLNPSLICLRVNKMEPSPFPLPGERRRSTTRRRRVGSVQCSEFRSCLYLSSHSSVLCSDFREGVMLEVHAEDEGVWDWFEANVRRMDIAGEKVRADISPSPASLLSFFQTLGFVSEPSSRP